MNITFGCSHTFCPYMEPQDRWTSILEQKTGIHVKMIAKTGSGLAYLTLSCRNMIDRGELEPDEIQNVVIQKPSPIRFPWWETDESGYRYAGLLQREGWTKSNTKFKKLSKDEKEEVADRIFIREFEMLREFREMLPQARFFYFHYWADHLMDAVMNVAFENHNMRLGVLVDSIMTNWDMIVDPKNIPGAHDDEGDILLSGKIVYEHGWIWRPLDFHPSRKYNELVADKFAKELI